MPAWEDTAALGPCSGCSQFGAALGAPASASALRGLGWSWGLGQRVPGSVGQGLDGCVRLGTPAGDSDMLCPQDPSGSHPSACTPRPLQHHGETGSFQGLCSGEAKRERLFLCQSGIRGIVHAGHVGLAVLDGLRRWRCPGAFSALSVP